MARLRYNGLATGSSGSTVGLSLGASLTSGATSVTFNAALTHSNGTAVPTIVSPDYIPLEILDANGRVSEIVWLTAYTAAGTTGTIGRGKEGTTGVAHSSGDKIVGGATVDDLRAVTVSAFNVAGTTISDNSETVIPLASESFDTDGFHDNTTNNSRLTVPTGLDGFYMVTASVAYVFNSSGSRSAAVYKNGSKVGEAGVPGATSSTPFFVILLQLVGGDYVEMATYQDSGSSRTLSTGGLVKLSMIRVG